MNNFGRNKNEKHLLHTHNDLSFSLKEKKEHKKIKNNIISKNTSLSRHSRDEFYAHPSKVKKQIHETNNDTSSEQKERKEHKKIRDTTVSKNISLSRHNRDEFYAHPSKIGRPIDQTDEPPNVTSVSEDKLNKPLGQILAEIVLCKDSDEKDEKVVSEKNIEEWRKNEKEDKSKALDFYEEQYKNNSRLVKLIQQYRSIEKYIKVFENHNKDQIKQWAKTKSSSSEIVEFIAVLYCANLILEGQRLRDPQIFALLVFLNTEKGKGQLCQILTGEGKTTIVALLAIIKASKGETVDVITSNPVLAQEGVDKKAAFYELFNLTVKTNNPDEKKDTLIGTKECYKANVVYGCISNFQFDYLKDTFEKLETRAGRPFGAVILDEVDSMVIDNGGHIAKLSGPLPGMEYFRYIYIRIWQALCQHEKNNLKPNAIRNELVKQMENFIPTQIIPSHLLDYAHQSLNRWIDNAINAKYQFHENVQYILKEKADGRVIVPVDNCNTGVSLNDTIWSYGLHQFIQLKHGGLYLTSENLTSSFISNLGYINKYNNNICGLTGTLGSVNEQSLLSEVYQVDYAKIPSFKSKKFTEIPVIVAENDSEWFEKMVVEICKMITREPRRAVLVICETILDAMHIESTIKNYIHSDKIRKAYFDEEILRASKDPVDVGEVIISTNIAGRGTDLNTTETLEKNGGLHVCVGFLPKNKRIEEQAFGRTSRQGKRGTAQMIIRQNEIPEIKFLSDCSPTEEIKIIKQSRDLVEAERIKEIREKKLKELRFDDAIFSLFSDLYSYFKRSNEENSDSYFLCSDLKEWWAFFFETLTPEIKKNTNVIKNVNDKFSEFKNNRKTLQIISAKRIAHNPYYGIRLAEHWIKNGKFDIAKKNLDNSFAIAGLNKNILYPLYFKYFEICIESGNAVQHRLNQALADLFFIETKHTNNYKEEALENLLLAKKGIENEIDYIDPEKNENPFVSNFHGRYIVLNVFKWNIEQLIAQMSGMSEEKQKFYFDEKLIKEVMNENIVEFGTDPFLNQCREKRILATDDVDGWNAGCEDLLRNKLSNIDQKHVTDIYIKLEEQREATFVRNKQDQLKISGRTHSEEDFAIVNRNSDYFNNLDEKDQQQKIIKEALKAGPIVGELYFIGLEYIYGLKTIYTLDQLPIRVAQVEMIAGISFQAAAIASAPIPLLVKVFDTAAGFFISESVCGLISEIFNGEEKFDEAQYWKNKEISYAISIGIAILGGILAIASKSQFISRAKLSFIEKWSRLTKNSYFNNLSQKLNYFKILPKRPLPLKLFSLNLSEEVVKKVGKALISAGVNQLIDKVINPLLSDHLQDLKTALKEKVNAILNADLEKELLQTVLKDKIIDSSIKIISEHNNNEAEIDKRISQEIVGGSLQALNTKNTLVNITGYALGIAIKNITEFVEISEFSKSYCKMLNEMLKSQSNQENNDVGPILSVLIEQVLEYIYQLVFHVITTISEDVVVNPTLDMLSHSSPQQSQQQESKGFSTRFQQNLKAFNHLSSHGVRENKLAGSGQPLVEDPGRKRRSLTEFSSFFAVPKDVGINRRHTNMPRKFESRTRYGSFRTRDREAGEEFTRGHDRSRIPLPGQLRRSNSSSGDFRGSQVRVGPGINVIIPLPPDKISHNSRPESEVGVFRAESDHNSKMSQGRNPGWISVGNPSRSEGFSERSRLHHGGGKGSIERFNSGGQTIRSSTVSRDQARDLLTSAQPEHKKDRDRYQGVDRSLFPSRPFRERQQRLADSLNTGPINVDTRAPNQLGVGRSDFNLPNKVDRGFTLYGRRRSLPEESSSGFRSYKSINPTEFV